MADLPSQPQREQEPASGVQSGMGNSSQDWVALKRSGLFIVSAMVVALSFMTSCPQQQRAASTQEGEQAVAEAELAENQAPADERKQDSPEEEPGLTLAQARELAALPPDEAGRRLAELNLEASDEALIAALVDKDITAAALLLAGGANPDALAEDNVPALMVALFTKQETVAHLLIDAGADVNGYCIMDHSTPLMYAAAAGAVELLDRLLVTGAKLDAVDDTGRSPLFMACMTGQAATVECLLELGVDPNQVDRRNTSPLINAASFLPAQAVALLIQHGADVNAVNEDSLTPLLMAAGAGKADTVALLLEHGADLDAVMYNGYNALHQAAQANAPETLRILLEQGLDINSREKISDYTPLMVAVNNGALDAVELLLERGADRGLKNRRGETALEMAQSMNLAKITELLQ